jgi:glycerol-3-phosphate dehydrogenase
VLTLLGGKYTTAAWTALEGVMQAAKLLGRSVSSGAIAKRPDLKKLPGSAEGEALAAIEKVLLGKGLTPETATRLMRRYGKRLEGYLDRVEPSLERIVQLETMIALDTEQVESVEDLMRRRLELEYVAGHGEMHLSAIRELFLTMRPTIDFERESREYIERMKRIDDLLVGRS